jgi:hypothetical protein
MPRVAAVCAASSRGPANENFDKTPTHAAARGVRLFRHRRKHVGKWRVKGIGPRYSKLNRRMVVYDPDEVDRFLEERTQSSTAENPRPAPPPKRPRGLRRKQPPADLAAE